MTKEGRLRKPQPREWPSFLHRLIPDQTWRGLQKEANSPKNPRTRWTPKSIILCWVTMAWSIQGQLTERFREGYETLGQMFYRRRRCGRSYQGLILATAGLGLDLFQHFWYRLRVGLPQRAGQLWTWFGWVVFAVDGSRVEAPRTRHNERQLGRAGREKSPPQWWITRLIHLPTKLSWDWRQGPGRSSERTHLRQMLPTLPPNTLLVADIGFGGFELLTDLCRKRISFLIRCGANTTLLVVQARQWIERKGDVRYVYLWPINQRRRRPLQLRLIVLKRRGHQPVYLLTNVLEPTRLSRRTAGTFYQARWGIEVEYRGFKQTLGHRKLLARSPGPGAMELGANLLAMALLLLYAALVQGAKLTRFSLAQGLRAMRRAIEALRYGASCQFLPGQLAQALLDDYQRHFPKRARDWPHKKNDPPPSPPKLRRLQPGEKARIQELLRAHQAVLT
jgi:hypothetical protein